MDPTYVPKLWDRAKFYDANGNPTIIGIVVEADTLEGQKGYKVLIESREDDVDETWQEGNPFGLQQFWDYEACEGMGKTSFEEMILSEKEIIRDFATQHREQIENDLDPSDSDLCSYHKREELKQKIADADDDELDKLIDLL